MSPELVQEKPYDHNSDLWSVLSELSVQFERINMSIAIVNFLKKIGMCLFES